MRVVDVTAKFTIPADDEDSESAILSDVLEVIDEGWEGEATNVSVELGGAIPKTPVGGARSSIEAPPVASPEDPNAKF